MIRITAPVLEWATIGDCAVLLHSADDVLRLEREHDHDGRTRALLGTRASGVTVTEDEIEAARTQTRAEANRTYGALNGDARADAFVRSGEAPLADLRDVLLFTDGLWAPDLRTEVADDVARFFAVFRAGGLTALRDHGRSIERADSDCRRWPRLKRHDDIAAVALAAMDADASA